MEQDQVSSVFAAETAPRVSEGGLLTQDTPAPPPPMPEAGVAPPPPPPMPETAAAPATVAAPAEAAEPLYGWAVDPYKMRAFGDALTQARSYLDAVQMKVERMQGAELTPQLGTSPVGQQLGKKFDDRLNSTVGLRAMLEEAMRRMQTFVASAEAAARSYEEMDDNARATFDGIIPDVGGLLKDVVTDITSSEEDGVQEDNPYDDYGTYGDHHDDDHDDDHDDHDEDRDDHGEDRDEDPDGENPDQEQDQSGGGEQNEDRDQDREQDQDRDEDQNEDRDSDEDRDQNQDQDETRDEDRDQDRDQDRGESRDHGQNGDRAGDENRSATDSQDQGSDTDRTVQPVDGQPG